MYLRITYNQYKGGKIAFLDMILVQERKSKLGRKRLFANILADK